MREQGAPSKPSHVCVMSSGSQICGFSATTATLFHNLSRGVFKNRKAPLGTTERMIGVLGGCRGCLEWLARGGWPHDMKVFLP